MPQKQAGPAHMQSLRGALDEADWNPRDLTSAVNSWLERHGRSGERIHPTTAYPWVQRNYFPHNGIAEVVATVLSARLGRYVGAEQLWPGHARGERLARSERLPSDGTLDDAIRSLDQLAAGSRPLQISTADLSVAAISALRDPAESHGSTRDRDLIHHAQAGLIANHVAELRQLDDCQGGGALSLRYVSRELSTVLDLLRCGSYEPEVGKTLMTSVSDLAQLAGWMQFDAGDTEVAQRYLVLGIRIARAARDDDRAVNQAGMLAYIASEAKAGTAALAITDAASRLSTTSLFGRARLEGRRATALAAAGDIGAFQTASDRAQELLTSARQDHTQPYLYYLTPEQLNAEAGYSLVTLAQRTELHQRKLLRQAADLLSPRAHLNLGPGYERSAVLHGCQLAQAHLLLKDLDGVVAAARVATTLVPAVQSRRCATKLRGLHKSLKQRSRSRVVAEFLPELEHALGGLR
ncbi:hypothetical protein [Nocardia salmonicida]|uniref:hypothetical protein n=1 Tax=Nocardia salmonicida TaxID=53431 RepID=UPI0012F51A6D|nr:hypothetical protein [Nocardia salmonicida]MBC7303192.1 hypothetical protein [Nocardia sp.]